MSDRLQTAIQADLAAARRTFHRQLAVLTAADLAQPSRNPAWSNGAVLFHMLLGLLVTVALLPLVWGFSFLPRPLSRLFAALLNALTPVFNPVNGVAARAAGRRLGHRALTALFTLASAILTWEARHTAESQLQRRGMYFPTRWDGLFRPYMSLDDVLAYPAQHLQFHADQLRPRTTPPR